MVVKRKLDLLDNFSYSIKIIIHGDELDVCVTMRHQYNNVSNQQDATDF